MQQVAHPPQQDIKRCNFFVSLSDDFSNDFSIKMNLLGCSLNIYHKHNIYIYTFLCFTVAVACLFLNCYSCFSAHNFPSHLPSLVVVKIIIIVAGWYNLQVDRLIASEIRTRLWSQVINDKHTWVNYIHIYANAHLFKVEIDKTTYRGARERYILTKWNGLLRRKLFVTCSLVILLI